MGKTKKKSAGLLTMNAYAKRRGVSHTAVAKAVKSGRISRTAEGLIDPERADREWADNTNPAKAFSSVVNNSVHRKSTDYPPMPFASPDDASASPANGLPPIAQSRAIREAYEARIRKLDYEVRKGRLINADEVRVAAFNIVRITRDRLMKIPERVAPLVAGLDAGEVHKVLSTEVRLACEELSKPDTYSNAKKVSE